MFRNLARIVLIRICRAARDAEMKRQMITLVNERALLRSEIKALKEQRNQFSRYEYICCRLIGASRSVYQ
jgi:hypothetical protein